ncbi:lipase 3 [Nasonia vitripennis]|uniref:Partial AB-hydrolase lipase domain-containing protein n=1 Tax=Nasonia vitripennis TaxID=7425 RepID=A0A7M7GC00_NASVI|nr:lipase 3 [Nasonia vitripennis]
MRLSGMFAEVLLVLFALSCKSEGSRTTRLEIETGAFVTRDKRQLFRRQLEQVQQILPQPGRIETFTDLVRSTGYHVEEHDITTDDGYILTVHRMPGGPRSPVTPKKPAVLFIHGLLAASDIWVLRGPDEDLAFMMVDAGYDVWLLNTRGNFYSRRHKKIVPKEEKFWRFSWHEFGVYDTASAIDHILRTTGQERVSLIGHSMGTTVGLVLLSMKPEYNAKVNTMLSFAPIAIFTHLVPGPISNIAVRYGKQLQKTFRTLGVHEIFPRNPSLVGAYATFCQTPHIELLCQRLIMNMAGLLKSSQFDAIDVDMMPKVLNHYPQGSSLETLLHYRQIMISGKFRQYDFGPEGNYIRYKNMTPPEYPLERITVPIVLYYGLNDAYTTKEDVVVLMAKLPNAEGRAIAYDRFSHLDFLFSNYTKDLLYTDVLQTLNMYREDRAPYPESLKQAIEYAKLAPTTVTV